MIIIVIRSLTPHNFSRLSWWWRFQKRTVKKHARRHQRILGDHLRIILFASNSMISSTIVYWKQFNVRMRQITPPPAHSPWSLDRMSKFSKFSFLKFAAAACLLAPPYISQYKNDMFLLTKSSSNRFPSWETLKFEKDYLVPTFKIFISWWVIRNWKFR